MSCKNTKKKGVSTFNMDTITNVINIIMAAFSIPSKPVSSLPPMLILTGAKLRPGLSSQAITARILSRQSEAGRVVGDVFTDGPNVEEAMELIRVEEIVGAIQTEAVVNLVIPAGTRVTTTGVGNMGAPVVSQGATTGMAVGQGIIT